MKYNVFFVQDNCVFFRVVLLLATNRLVPVLWSYVWIMFWLCCCFFKDQFLNCWERHKFLFLEVLKSCIYSFCDIGQRNEFSFSRMFTVLLSALFVFISSCFVKESVVNLFACHKLLLGGLAISDVLFLVSSWTAQLTLTCLQSTKETVEKGVNVLVFLSLALNIFETFFLCFCCWLRTSKC